MSTTASKRFATLGEAAERLAVCKRTVEKLVDEGRIRTWKVPGARPKLLAEDVERLVTQAEAGVGELQSA